MSKLTKRQIAAHDEAIRLLSQATLSEEEKEFVFENYREDARHINSKAGAFFTPSGLARDLAIHIPCKYGETTRIIDLCAGIGALSYAAHLGDGGWGTITWTSLVWKSTRIMSKLESSFSPEATWICGDALDQALLASLGHFDYAIANPPFGNIKTEHRESYHQGAFEYMVIEAASRIADGGAFILPQMSAPFIYSGARKHRWLEAGRARDFEAATGIRLEFNIGIDTSCYKGDWHCVAPVCEIVCCEFDREESFYENLELRGWNAEHSPGADLLCAGERENPLSTGAAV